jgi:hypothetical protein
MKKFLKNDNFVLNFWDLIGHASVSKYPSPLSITVLDSSLQDASLIYNSWSRSLLSF